MKFRWILHFGPIAVMLVAGLGSGQAKPKDVSQGNQSSGVPVFEVDPAWPKPLPNNWLTGQPSAITVDIHDHIWTVQRPKSLTADEAALAQSPPIAEECCIPAPPVMEFDADGNLLQAWGGPGIGYDWPSSEHGIFVDFKDNVWVTGNHQVLKFTGKGQLLLQIGEAGKTGGSNSKTLLGRPANMAVDPMTNEIYVADGYVNHRVVVFDASTGAYKRHWGAYGNKPDDADPGKYHPDAAPALQFRNPVHCVEIANDGLVYVCDRGSDRIQVFRKDGTFVKEAFIAKRTLGVRGEGSVWEAGLSPDQKFLYVADGSNQKVWILVRDSLAIVGSFGRSGRSAGQFHWVHGLAVDSKGNIYTAEVDNAKRVQKFLYKGIR